MSDPKTGSPSRRPTRGERAYRMRNLGKGYAEIAKELGTTIPRARQAVDNERRLRAQENRKQKSKGKRP